MSEGHTTPEGQSVFYDLFTAGQAANLLVRAKLLDELINILQARFTTQAEAAAAMGVTQARISDLYRGKIQRFTVDMLINLLAAVGRDVEITTKAAA